MDKYEFNLKIEQLKKLIDQEDYVTALKIVQTVDWNRVRNTNLLTMAATVYEKNEMLQDSKDMLILAFERAPVGKHLLFKLTELSCKTGDLEEAEDYYHEFRSIDSTDIGNYLLQYMILKARHAPYERQLLPLERYCNLDPDEKWLFELASAYAYANRLEECVKTCDKVALLYGGSQYGVKALRLKARYTGLTDVQKNLITPRTVPEDKINYEEPVYDETSFKNSEDTAEEESKEDVVDIRERMAQREEKKSSAGIYDDREYRYSVADEPVTEEHYKETPEEIAERDANLSRISDELAAERYMDEDAAFDAYVRAYTSGRDEEPRSSVPAAADSENPALSADGANNETPDGDGVQMAFDFGGDEPAVVNEPASVAEAEMSAEAEANADSIETLAAAAAAVTEQLPEAKAEPEQEARAEAPVIPIKQAEPEEEQQELFVKPAPQPVQTTMTDPVLSAADIARAVSASGASIPEAAAKVPAAKGHHMIVEAESIAEGLSIAIDELKNIHEENRIEHASIKTSAEKLNQNGITPGILEKVKGKDFVIENAGALSAFNIETIYDFIKTDRTGTIVVLIDTPEGLDNIEDLRPELFDICDYVSDIDEDEEDSFDEGASKSYNYDDDDDETDVDEPYDEAFGDDDDEDEDEEDDEDDEDEDEPYEEEPEERKPVKRSNGNVTAERFYNVKEITPSRPDHQMEIDEFAQYCAQYASEIDCSITGTSMLALYERIELMEEDGIPLTKTNAEQLIEEAADRAEKPPIGKRITGMFKSKYDKNGLLILKEDDFIF